jgi:hypothetical protein
MQVVIRPAAAADIEDAFAWYEQQRSRLGYEFLKVLDDALIAIQRAPQLHPVIHRNTPASLCERCTAARPTLHVRLHQWTGPHPRFL